VSIENFDPSKDNQTPHIDLDLYLGILEEKNEKTQPKDVKSTTDKLLGVNTNTIIIKEDDSPDTDQDDDLILVD